MGIMEKKMETTMMFSIGFLKRGLGIGKGVGVMKGQTHALKVLNYMADALLLKPHNRYLKSYALWFLL